MTFTKRHVRENRRVLTAARKLVAGDTYATAWERYKSGELVDELTKQFPDIPLRRLRKQAAKAYRQKKR